MTSEDVNRNSLRNFLHQIVETHITSVERSLIAEIETRVTSAKRSLIADIDRLFQQNSVPRRELKLHFINKISQPILTGEEIKGEGDTSIVVVLIDTCTGNVVDVGAEASASVEIVPLKGDESDACEGENWFNDNIVQVELGKLPLLAGNIRVKLDRGRGEVKGIKFRNDTVKMNPNMFRLGARFVEPLEGIQVKEAKTEVFAVKDFRNKYTRKHDFPSLSDKVWRLRNIQKGGKIDDRLRNIGVSTVEDFLTELLRNPEKLKDNVKLGAKKWDETVNHARRCSIGQRRYCYINSEQKSGIVFDLLGNVLGLFLNGCSTDNILSSDQDRIEELKSSAIINWTKDTVVSFDNEIQVMQHLNSNLGAIPQPKRNTRDDEPVPDEAGPSKKLKSCNSVACFQPDEAGPSVVNDERFFEGLEEILRVPNVDPPISQGFSSYVQNPECSVQDSTLLWDYIPECSVQDSTLLWDYIPECSVQDSTLLWDYDNPYNQEHNQFY